MCAHESEQQEIQSHLSSSVPPIIKWVDFHMNLYQWHS